MHIDWWTLALQGINVLVLVWLLTRFLYRPVMAVIAARRQAADKLLADAEAAKVAAAAEAMALKAQNEVFNAEAEKRQGEMRAAVETEHAQLLARAKAEAATVLQRADTAAAAARVRMRVELEEEAAVLAGRMSETLLQRLPAAQATDAMFQALLDRLRALPEDERRKLVTDMPLRVVTAAPLEDGARERYRRALADILSAPTLLDFAADPALIAGFELHGRHVRVRNSWHADLEEMLARLKEGGNDR